ncbi:30S ribosomal protein S17 [Candidatus Omnitrophota bacterium]
MTQQRAKRKQRIGVVVSDKMNKTRVVQVKTITRHATYSRVIRKANKFKAHDETNAAKTGDTVRIIETRPLSKDKRWRIAEILTPEKKSEA